MVTPSGLTSARYSPDALRLKLVCNVLPGMLRSLLSAKITMNAPAAMLVAGMRHFVRLLSLSVRYQPSRLTAFVLELRNSIQSAKRLSSSFRPLVFAARNSEMVTCSAARRAVAVQRNNIDKKQDVRLRIGCLGCEHVTQFAFWSERILPQRGT